MLKARRALHFVHPFLGKAWSCESIKAVSLNPSEAIPKTPMPPRTPAVTQETEEQHGIAPSHIPQIDRSTIPYWGGKEEN